MDVTHTMMDSPLGELTLVGNDGALAGVYFAGQRNRPRPGRLGRRAPAGLAEPVRQLGEYFAGERTAFELARELGDPALAQKVGVSNARNRLCIVVPCHRVVGADGKLTGYAGGLARKRALLELEAPVPAGRLF